MNFQCKLVVLILVLTLDDQVHTGEIIGGNEAAPHSRPYMVLLERTLQDGTKRHCDGFLLNEDFVMTAAHCVAKSYKVFLGLHNYNEQNGIQLVLVEQAFPSKDYNETGYKSDIMLLKMSSKPHLSKTVEPIALAGQGDVSLPKSCIISGWGATDREEGSMSLILMETNVTLIDSTQCLKECSYCSKGNTGPGVGDSGGPLVCEGKAYGVVSSTYTPSNGGPLIHHYAKIPDYRHWIDSALKYNAKF
ncbi:granzyme E-like [Scomber scombrus]|uniref:trypsin n=1 Tax=Scomber scombrus TaxID=13677 RepID=A0AAV1N7W0_SCOSC|nr:granzyme E-like [Scomber scombrus]